MYYDLSAESQCNDLSAPAGVKMSCDVKGDDTVCILNCSQNGRFAIDTDKSVMSTHCGPGTGYRWDHQAKNITLPACSGNYNRATKLRSLDIY